MGESDRVMDEVDQCLNDVLDIRLHIGQNFGTPDYEFVVMLIQYLKVAGYRIVYQFFYIDRLEIPPWLGVFNPRNL